MQKKMDPYGGVGVAVVLPLMLFVVSPLNFFFGNQAEINFGIDEALPTLLTLFVGSAMFLYILIVSTKKWPGLSSAVPAVLVSVSGLAFVQGQVLLWDFGPLDGRGIEWTRWTYVSVGEVVAWVITVAFFVLLSARYRNLPVHLSLVLLFTGLLSVAAGWLSAPANEVRSSSLETRSNVFHEKNNVILIVLDTFQSGAFGEIMSRHPKEVGALDGFVYYPNALAGFPTTYPSLVLALTGRYYRNEQPIGDFLAEAYGAEGVPKVAGDAGYGQSYTVVAPSAYEGVEVHGGNVESLEAIARDVGAGNFHPGLRLVDMGLFRSLPTIMKPYIYADGQWLSSRLGRKKLPPTDHGTDVRFVSWLVDNIRVGSKMMGELKVYHFFGAHLPIVMDENQRYWQNAPKEWPSYVRQARGSFRLVTDIVNELKVRELYDTATIAVIGDHGTMNFPPADGGCKSQWNCSIEPKKQAAALPLFLYKPAGSGGALEISEEPVSLGDVPCFLEAGIGSSACKGNRESVTEKRLFYWYEWGREARGKQYLPPMVEYQVGDNAHDPSNWVSTGQVYAKGGATRSKGLGRMQIGQKVSLLDDGSYPFVSFGWSVSEGTHRWTDGDEAGLRFYVNGLESASGLVFDLAASPYLANGNLSEQTVKVVVNGTDVATWQMSSGGVHSAQVPQDVLRGGERIRVKFMLPDAVSPSEYGLSQDPRKLAVAARWFRVRKAQR